MLLLLFLFLLSFLALEGISWRRLFGSVNLELHFFLLALRKSEGEALRKHLREILVNGRRTLEVNFLTRARDSIPFEVSFHVSSAQNVVEAG